VTRSTTDESADEAPGSSLGAYLDEVVAGLGAEADRAAGRTELRVDGRLVAAWTDVALEVELGDAVAAAALRTADVRASAQGAGWVRFTPARLDRFARDRASSWVAFAARSRG
jgi:hypothetical protein